MIRWTPLLLAAVACFGFSPDARADKKPLNLLIVTVDDMSCDSVGAYGCPVPDTTPAMDKLAADSFIFRNAHVVVGNCFPSRNVMWSGLYPHNTGVEGFYHITEPKHAHLVDVLQAAGYHTSIRGKVSHSTPYHPYHWDAILDTLPNGEKAHMKDAESYGISTRMGIEAAREAGKPFCVMINISDPHKPFYAENKDGSSWDDPHVPSKVFSADDITVPGFLFEDQVARKELAHYYSSVRRADDCVAETLKTLEELGEKDNTIVLFLSDHGMPLPFAKTQVYHHSSRTPLMIRWPGVTKAGAEDDAHMVSAVDLMPTLIEMLDVKELNPMDGRSLVPILKGRKQKGREFVIKEYNENSGRSRDPMRAIQTREFLYIFNPWSNGERVFATATNGTPTYKKMKELAETDSVIEARHDLYQLRTVEELYDITTDPDCLHNLIDDPKYAETLDDLRGKLAQWMKDTNDHCLVAFEGREDPEVMEAYVLQKEAESAARGPKKEKQVKVFNLVLPDEAAAGTALKLRVNHDLPEKVGKTNLCVTLKDGDGKRLDRKTLTVSGKARTPVEFDLPADLAGKQLQVAAWIGPDYQTSLQHMQKGPIQVR